MLLEILIVASLILTNGFFALSEMSVVTARKQKLKQLAQDSARAQTALELAEHPERFLSTVQVGITLIGVMTGVFGGATIGQRIGSWIAGFPIDPELAMGIGTATTVALITYFSIIFGELVPKRIALVAPERIASIIALPMSFVARAFAPFAWLLSISTRLLVRVLGIEKSTDSQVSEEEIKLLVAESAEQGVIDAAERSMVNRALTLGDRTVDSLMTPRTRIAWLDLEATPEENLAVMRETPYSRYPVKRGTEQDVAGVLQVKALTDALGGKKLDLFRTLQPPLFVPETARAAHLLEKFRDSETPLSLVVDEYGDIQGLVTLNDVALAVLGRYAHASQESGDAPIVQRADGSWLVDGAVSVDDLRELLGTGELPEENEQEYRTAAGMLIAHFGRIPQSGEFFSWRGFRFEVVDLDGARIDKLLVCRTVPPEPDISV